LCLFNPIRKKLTGQIVSWSDLDRQASRSDLVDRVERGANTADATWDEQLEPPLLGAPDPLCRAALEDTLPHARVKAVLFPMNEANTLELDWPSLMTRLATNDYDAPVLWWDLARTFVVATPNESVLTYVCGSVSLIEKIEVRAEIETERLV
jgi:hypothetical protein